MEIKVCTTQPDHFIRETGKVLLQRGYRQEQVDALQNGQRDGELITFVALSEAQFCALEDTAVCMDLRYDGSQGDQEQKPVAPPHQNGGVRIRALLGFCGPERTLLQITVTMQASIVQFAHPDHSQKPPALCRHAKPSGECMQAVLRVGDRGTLTIDEQTISFLVLDQELAEINNPATLPLQIETV